MRSKIRSGLRTCALVVAAHVLSGGVIWAEPSDCAASGVGGQTGDSYSLQYQSLVTETTTATLGAGGSCGISASTGGTRSEQYYVGYYHNDTSGGSVAVDCRTGRVLAHFG